MSARTHVPKFEMLLSSIRRLAWLTHRWQNLKRAGSHELVLVSPGHPFRYVIEEALAHPTLSPRSTQSRSALNSAKGRQQTAIDVARRFPARDTLDMEAVSGRCHGAGDEFLEYRSQDGRVVAADVGDELELDLVTHLSRFHDRATVQGMQPVEAYTSGEVGLVHPSDASIIVKRPRRVQPEG